MSPLLLLPPIIQDSVTVVVLTRMVEKMKKIAFALLCICAAGSAVAQTYACQFIMQAGMDKDPKSGWKIMGFKPPEPFFITMSNGLISTKSVAEPPLMMPTFSTTCMKIETPSLGVSHWCAAYSDYLSFSEKTLNGAFTKTFGAMQSSNANETDSVTVSRFRCQKIR